MSYWKHNIEGIEWDELKLWQREMAFKAVCNDNNVELDQPPLCVVWEDPEEPDKPVKITVPSPTWWAMALHGNILPPVEAYHELKKDEAQPDFTRHKRGNLLHDTQPMPPMTPEQAMTYLILKDLPPHVWGYQGNRTIVKVVSRDTIPTDRTNRNAWTMKDIAA